MKKKLLCLVLVVMLAVSMIACSKTPEEVEALQYRIDKAIETPQPYSELREIKSLYDALLMEHQEMIINYEQIESMLAITSEEVAAVFVVQKIQNRLVNPNSLEVISIQVGQSPSGYYNVCIEYSAENSMGGRIENSYYASVDVPTYDESSQTWSCKYEDLFSSLEILEVLGEVLETDSQVDSQAIAKDRFSSTSAINLEAEKVVDNIDMSIIELEREE